MKKEILAIAVCFMFFVTISPTGKALSSDKIEFENNNEECTNPSNELLLKPSPIGIWFIIPKGKSICFNEDSNYIYFNMEDVRMFGRGLGWKSTYYLNDVQIKIVKQIPYHFFGLSIFSLIICRHWEYV